MDEEKCMQENTRVGGQGQIYRDHESLSRPPTAIERSYPKDVSVTKVDNGFIVRVGCKTFVGKDWDAVSNGLDVYFHDPAAAEKLYCKK